MTAQQRSVSSIRQTIASSFEEAERLFLGIRGFMQARDKLRLSFPVELLARECVVNAIVHGNRMDADKSVELSIRIGRTWIRLDVSDEGDGFAWRGAGRRGFTEHCSNGRGLQLFKLYADRVRFNRHGNRIAVWIRRTRKGN